MYASSGARSSFGGPGRRVGHSLAGADPDPGLAGAPVWNGRATYAKETKGQYVNETIRIDADYQLSDSGLPLKGTVRLSDVGKVNSPGSGGKGGSGPRTLNRGRQP